MSESPAPYLDPLTSRKDYNYIALDEERYPPVVHRNWDFRCTAKQSSWPFLATEDAMDTMSLLSEESCSSSAVRGGPTKKSASKLMKLKTGSKSHGSDLPKILEKNVNNLNKKEMCANLGEVCQEKNLKGVGNYKNVPNFSSPRTGHFLKEFPAIQKISEPRHSFLVDEGYTSVHEELDMCPFHRTCMELNTTSLNCNVRTEDDLFCPFSITKSYPNPESSRKRSKFDALGNHAPSACYFSEKDVAQQPVQPAHSYDSHISSSIRSRLMKPDIQLASRTEGHPPHSSCVLDLQKGDEVPDVSRRYNVRKDEDELGFRPTGFREALKELPKGVSIENSDLSSGNGNTADVADFKDSCSELEEAKDENPEPIESPKARNSPEHGEEIPLATKERPGKLEGCINAKQYNNDADVPVLLQSGNEEKEPSRAVNTKIGSEGHASGDPSYQVMLESYVLQLLCVQKLLKEASEPNNVKKV
ncbi:uncharacterized protein LOC131253610 isoform X2 [Magnolia sinica]|nr:uncharacterized protein LOC131253610 isoform X2 [Magnolia sinica]